MLPLALSYLVEGAKRTGPLLWGASGFKFCSLGPERWYNRTFALHMTNLVQFQASCGISQIQPGMQSIPLSIALLPLNKTPK